MILNGQTVPANTSKFDDNKYHHLATTYDRGHLILYLDGTQVAANESEWVDPGSTVFLGGGHSGNDDCNGVIDDFRIYDRPITLEEVQQLSSR